jgi:hypothetical protein
MPDRPSPLPTTGLAAPLMREISEMRFEWDNPNQPFYPLYV